MVPETLIVPGCHAARCVRVDAPER